MIRTNSIVFKFSVQLTIILAILFSVLVISNIYSLEVVQNNSKTNSRNLLAIYKANIQNNFSNSAEDLIEVFEAHVDSALSMDQLDENGRYFKSIQLANALSMKMSRDASSDVMFIKIPGSDLLLTYFSNRISSENKLRLLDYLNSYTFRPAAEGDSDKWVDFNIQNVHYVYKAITYSEVTFGTIIQADTLLSLVNQGGNDPSHYVLSNRNGVILSSDKSNVEEEYSTMIELQSKLERKFLMFTEPIPEFGLITNMVAKQSVFSGLQKIQWIIVMLAIISVVIVPLVLRLLARDILTPVLKLVKASKEVEKGQHEFQIPQGHFSMEFTKLFHSFQSMVREITDLKIQSYEEEIERSQLEIKYLQIQIRPHFYLNAISTITSLTYQNKNEEIRMLIQHLSEHLRYMFKGGITEVSIDEEIRHAENYIRMQEIRYPDQIFYMTEIDAEAAIVQIPQFIILTFVENAFKHAMFYGDMLSIFIRVSTEAKDEKPFVKIAIEDNGEGFPVEWLQQEESAVFERNDADHSRIGVANMRRTLQLFYKRDDLLKLSNVEPSGAKVELWIPIQESVNETGKEARHALPVDR